MTVEELAAWLAENKGLVTARYAEVSGKRIAVVKARSGDYFSGILHEEVVRLEGDGKDDARVAVALERCVSTVSEILAAKGKA